MRRVIEHGRIEGTVKYVESDSRRKEVEGVETGFIWEGEVC